MYVLVIRKKSILNPDYHKLSADKGRIDLKMVYIADFDGDLTLDHQVIRETYTYNYLRNTNCGMLNL